MLGNHLVNVSSAAERKHYVLYTRSQSFRYVGRQVQSSEQDLYVQTDKQVNLIMDFKI